MGKPKFGVFLPFYAFRAKTPAEHFSLLKTIVLECDRLGYDSVWLDDHLMYKDWAILEPWTTLAALSALTSRIRLGTMVTCNAHRNPALLAKTAASFDVLSNGRLEFGLGAGIQESEHIAYGFDFPNSKVRIEQLDEALELIKLLWTQDKASFEGKHYKLKEAVCEPKPLQKPHPPITVGGSGEKFTLKAAAKHANRFDWGFLPPQEYKRKLEVLEKHCRAVGRDFGEIEKACWPTGQILLAKDLEELNVKISNYKPATMSLEEFKQYAFTGTPEQFKAQMQVYQDLGVTYFMLCFADLPSLEGLRLFAEGVSAKFS